MAAFLARRSATLDLALYDVRLPGEPGDLVAGALRDAAARGVAVRIAYNADHDERVFPPPPRTEPELLEALPVPHLRHPGHPRPDAPQVRGARRRVGLDRLDQLDHGLVDASRRT